MIGDDILRLGLMKMTLSSESQWNSTPQGVARHWAKQFRRADRDKGCVSERRDGYATLCSKGLHVNVNGTRWVDVDRGNHLPKDTREH